MQEKELTLKDGHRLFYRVWPVERPVATVHINHGMAEHSLRYDDFATFLNGHGFVVYAQDHRGHGYTCEEDEKGWFSEKDGWSLVCDDAFELDKIIMDDYPLLSHFIFGHSMGSFISRICLARHSEEYDAAVICGTGSYQGIIGKAGQAIAKSHAKKWGSKMRDPDLDNLAFSSYGKHFKGEGKFSWLSRDRKEVEKYEKDPLCGFVCSSKFYCDLIELSNQANNKKEVLKVRKSLPIFIISGSEDPVGGYSSGVKKVYALYKNAGLENVEMKLYEGARHEILNETNKNEVYNDIVSFYNKILKEGSEE